MSLLIARSNIAAFPLRPALELAALALTAILHLCWPEDLSRALLVGPIIVAWLGYFWTRLRHDPHLLREMGLRREGLTPTLAACLSLFAVVTPVLVFIGWLQGAEVSPWIVASLLGYPAWGLVQQLLLQGLLTRNLARLVSAPVAVFISSALFALVHWNEPLLVPATFLLGLFFAPLYLRYRNLWALGWVHGWLGAFFYTFVLMRDPLSAYLVG